MTRISSLAFALLIITAFGLQSASAQFPIKVPEFPGIEKPKADPPRTAGGQSESAPAPAPAPTAGTSAASPDQPTIGKDSIQVTAFTNSSYRGNYDIWSWVPRMEYIVNGPISSGSQIYAEFTIPGSAPLKFDCATQQLQKGYWVKTDCGGTHIPEAQSTTYVGPVNFAIRMRNELSGTETTFFNGKMKVVKAPSNEASYVNHFVYYVDHDWNLPIGYIFYEPDASGSWDLAGFRVAFWVRGKAAYIEPHLFYQGKEVGLLYRMGEQIGKPGCTSEVTNGETLKTTWARVKCHFPAVLAWDKRPRDAFYKPNELFMVHSNPGEYELKVLWNNKLARSIKFTVDADGMFDNGIASANKLGSDRVIVAVQIIGDQDGQWNRAAWQTEAFYGNPLQGFTATGAQ